MFPVSKHGEVQMKVSLFQKVSQRVSRFPFEHFCVLAYIAMVGAMLLSSFVVHAIMPFFRMGVYDRVAVSPLTHVVLDWTLLIWLPPILGLTLLVLNIFKRGTNPNSWALFVIALFLIYTVVLVCFLTGLSWPCWRILD